MKALFVLALLALPVCAVEPGYLKLTKQSCTIGQVSTMQECSDKKTKLVGSLIERAAALLSDDDKRLLRLYDDRSIEIVDENSFNTNIVDYPNSVFVLSSPDDKQQRAVFPIYIGKRLVLDIVEKNQIQDAIVIMLSGALAHEIEHLRGGEEKEADQAAIRQIRRMLETKLDNKVRIMVSAFLKNLENAITRETADIRKKEAFHALLFRP